MSKKQTAVEWLREQFHKVPYSQFGNLFEQAKKMEKEQMKESFFVGDDAIFHGVSETDFKTFEQYYKETYGE